MEELISEKKKSANTYRKDGDFVNAIPIYESLWKENGDAFDGAGLLSCYRKTCMFDKALPLAEELAGKHGGLDWAEKEICWTLIQGRTQKFNDETPWDEVIQTTNKIFDFNPDFLAKKLIVFKVLKLAKNKNDWNTIASWVDRVEVDKLSTVPIQLTSGRDGWSDQCLWYNYKINSLLKTEDFDKAESLAQVAEEKCPKQGVFFLRLKAHAKKGLGESEAAINLYEKLCKNRIDWWLLQEYGNLLKDHGERDKALMILCKAALSKAKLEMMVRLFSDIAGICIENDDFENARCHYYLEKFIRNENEWPLTSDLTTAIQTLDKRLSSKNSFQNKQQALSMCKSFWRKNCGENTSKTIKKKSGLIGKITIIKQKPFCFVNTKDGLSAICFPNDISGDVNNGDTVVFDIIPSFDKKKNTESWKAIKIKKVT